MFFEFSKRSMDLQERLNDFMQEFIYPNEGEYHKQVREGERWKVIPLIEELKEKARAEGLWNLFLPESEYGAGLTNYEYAPLCEIMGRSLLAPEALRCSSSSTWGRCRCPFC